MPNSSNRNNRKEIEITRLDPFPKHLKPFTRKLTQKHQLQEMSYMFYCHTYKLCALMASNFFQLLIKKATVIITRVNK